MSSGVIGMSSRARKTARRVDHARRRDNAVFDSNLTLFLHLKLKVITIEELGDLEPIRISAINALYQEEYGRECPWFEKCEPLENCVDFSNAIDVAPSRPVGFPSTRDDAHEEIAHNVVRERVVPFEAYEVTVLTDSPTSSVEEGIHVEESRCVTGDDPEPSVSFGIPVEEVCTLIGCESGLDIVSSHIPEEFVPLTPVLNLHNMSGPGKVMIPLSGLGKYYQFDPSGKLTIEDLLYDCELTQLQKAYVSATGARHASTLRHQTRSKLARIFVDVFGTNALTSYVFEPGGSRREIGQLITCMANAAEHRGRIVAGTTTLRIAAAWMFYLLHEFRLNRLGRYMPPGREYDPYRISPQERSRSGRLKKSKSQR